MRRKAQYLKRYSFGLCVESIGSDMEELNEKEEIYLEILKEADFKEKCQKRIIFKQCCPECCNYHCNCFEIEHKINYGIETYKCKNYIKCKEII